MSAFLRSTMEVRTHGADKTDAVIKEALGTLSNQTKTDDMIDLAKMIHLFSTTMMFNHNEDDHNDTACALGN